jgi:hypothetical protein
MSLLRILPVLALAGCATSPARDTTVSSCPGQRLVIVTNDWNQTVDVYASTGAVLGSVRPRGRQEFVLPDNARYAYGQAPPYARSRMVHRRLVRFRYVCQ